MTDAETVTVTTTVDPELFNRERDIRNSMKLYDMYHKLDEHRNFLFTTLDDTDSAKELANFLNQNYDHLGNEELGSILKRCLTPNGIRRIVLHHELKYYDGPEPKEMEMDEFIQEARQLFRRYQCKAGGFFFEDFEWSLFRYGDGNGDIKDCEVVFENSVSKIDVDNPDTVEYIDLMVRRLDNLATNIDVTVEQDQPEGDNIAVFRIRCCGETDVPDIEL